MIASADSRGVQTRISRQLRDIIHRVQRVESARLNTTLTVVEACEIVAERYLATEKMVAKLPLDTTTND